MRMPAITSRFLGICASMVLVASVTAATFTVSPTSIGELYSGNITLQIGGLTNGETVLVEHFLDLNTNGVIDAAEPLVQSFRLTEGHVTAIGGVRNGNVPGDNDLIANGQITSTLSFSGGTEFSRSSGKHLFRVSSPSSNFASLAQTLTVTQASYAQQITGTVTSGATPLPYAMVAALMPVGNNQEFICGAPADASGNFSLSVSNATYVIVAFKAGYLGNFNTSPMVAVNGGSTNVTVPLTAAPLTVSGTLIEATSSSPVPGVQFFFSSTNNEYAVFFSDAAGQFNVNVTSGEWKADISQYSLDLLGYLRSANKSKIDVSNSSVSGVIFNCWRGTAMIYGTLKDDSNVPLAGVDLFCNDNGNLYECDTSTDSNGNFFMVAGSGTWNLGPSDGGAGLPNGVILQNIQIALNQGQAVQTNLVARQASAWLAGRAVNSNGTPISNGMILAFNNNQNSSAQLGSDGSFAIPVWPGNWNIQLENQTAALYNVVSPQLSYNVTAGGSISNINYVAPVATRSISGWVRNGSGTGVGGLNLYAGATINGTNYGAAATTDNNGNYSMPVLPGTWNLGINSSDLSQQGYGPAASQTKDTTAGNQTANFTVGPPPVGTVFFRHNFGAIGEFGDGQTPAILYPVNIRNHRVIYLITDPNPPTADTVLFTGPPGSGLTNSPGDVTAGAIVPGGVSAYFSPVVRNPAIASGGSYTITYKGNPYTFNMPDPQAASRTVVPVPTITIQNGKLTAVHWIYRNQSGTFIGTPGFITTNRIDLFDQNGNGLDTEVFPTSSSYSYPATNQFSWSDISTLRLDYYDDLGNQYFVAFTETAPTLTSASFVPGQGMQFLLNGPAGQNFTIQYSTNLATTNWSTLYVTNGVSSPMSVVDRAQNAPTRFYRVLVGP